ncbi:type II secretion system F family protein [Vibrio sp. SCSIO 43136]|nr:type II secretion system F family protein [Vibrio sp. SCSIO 43136]
MRPTVQILVLVWALVTILATLFYYVFDYIRRKRYLRKFGLKLHEEKGTINYIEEATERLNKVFVSSTTDTSDKFIAAGMYNTQYASLVQPIKYLVAIIGGGAIAYAGFRLNWKMMDYILYESIWLVLVIILPDMYLRQRSVALQHKISNKLPYLLDLMGVCVQTGMTIESSMGYLGKEMANFDKDLAYMLKKTNDRARLVGLEIALQELYERVPTPEVRSFVMTLNQSLQYGSSIYGVLTTLATDIREVQMLGLEEKIGKLAAKMSVPLILFIMLPIVILITAPGIMRMLS